MALWKRLVSSPRELLLGAFRGAFGNDDWRPLLDFVSPSFFEVVPLRELLSQGRELVGNATDRSARAEVEETARKAIAAAGLPVCLDRTADADVEPGAGGDDRALGQRALELYFAQLYHGDACVLDLRSGTLRADANGAVWSPGPYFVRWQPDFLEALRELYVGFYHGQEAVFDAALRELDLFGSKDLFEHHFGAGDPEAVEFRTADFVNTFHDVFIRCRDKGVKLHRNFLPLGIYLATLHEHLGGLGGTFAVRSAFQVGSGD